MRVAVVQMTSGASVAENVERAEALVAESARGGPELVVLPERWNLIAPPEAMRRLAEPLDGPSLGAARRWAREHGTALVAGSIAEISGDPERPFNTSVLIGADGVDRATYRKLHLFDVDVGGRSYRESDATRPGDEIVVGDVAGARVGLSVCYDLRFPELYRGLTLRGAQVLAVPSAFTAHTGPAHWEVLLRARAIEQQAFVIAAGQVGRGGDGGRSHGHSMVVDPWGEVLVRIDAGEGVALAELSLERIDAVRTSLPALEHRRSDVYGDPV